ncbi:sensor histidine kinase [Nocardioides sp. DS6]|uniref:histidine kinase n=1 Tax=Nocardioides eburneus TaxID=3231482 RepID=A0ABV3SW98_9ACTN
MTDQTSAPSAAPLPLTDDVTLSSFQLVADAVTELAGFGVAVINVMADDGLLHTLVVAGSETARAELLGTTSRLDLLARELDRSDDWGLFRFVPAERVGEDEQPWGWVPDVSPSDDADAWHALDLLIAPLLDGDGVLRATLALDLPANGRRPSPEDRPALTRYADHAARIILATLERERLREEVRLRSLTREIVQQAAGRSTPQGALQSTADALVRDFDLLGVWLWLLGDGGQRHVTAAVAGVSLTWDASVRPYVERAARRLWARQQFGILGQTEAVNAEGTPEELTHLRSVLAAHGVESSLYAPVGARHVPLGMLYLYRGPEGAPWSEAECRAVQEMGHDLGTMIETAQELRREHRVARDLQELDHARSRLTATVSHELKSPLMAVRANVELLEEAPGDPELHEHALSAVARGTERLQRLVDGLRRFSRLGDPREARVRRLVDLAAVTEQAVALSAATATHRGVALSHHRAAAVVLGDPDELDQVVLNLVDNAVKYTPRGGQVLVTTARHGHDVELSVSDTGIGISEEDQARLFTEFFRSTDNAARLEPGTGLGLSIVDRIVRAHDGRIDVESALGVGSTFRVTLPAFEDA